MEAQRSAALTLPSGLSELIADLTDVRHNGFYRGLYSMGQATERLEISTIEEWRALPLLTKKHLIDTPLQRRMYCDTQDIEECIDATSGTSGGPPLFIARSNLSGFEFRKAVHDFSRPILCAIQPTPQRVLHMCRTFNPRGTALQLDPNNIEISLKLAKAAGTRSIIMPAHIARDMAEHIKRLGFADRITSIELNGSAASTSLIETLLDLLPHAHIVTNYGSTEAEGPPIAVSRPTRDTEEAKVFHPIEGFFLELIDPETLSPIEPAAGAEGELVLTRYLPRPFAFPLLRYRTGDVARIVHHDLSHPMQWSFSVCGRRELDFIKIPGGVLRSDEIERALREEFGSVVIRFEAEYSESEKSAGPRLGLTIYIQLADGARVSHRANMLAEKIRVSPSFTYAEGVRAGTYEPLVCREMTKELSANKPHRLNKTIVPNSFRTT